MSASGSDFMQSTSRLVPRNKENLPQFVVEPDHPGMSAELLEDDGDSGGSAKTVAISVVVVVLGELPIESV